ncbi:MAG TPA: DUF934 domain-containing protein [Burkholderiales bacterium]|nr:DUF934 domain-containing protein [Burkholderiales bacterium]
MTTLIKQRAIVTDTWQVIGAAGESDIVPLDGDIIVALERWIEQRETLSARSGRVGVWLGPADEPSRLVEAGPLPALIAVHFPAFTDGRGYSTARLLRQRYGFTGELRAIGDILRDELFELARCGFDAFALRADQDAQAALLAFDDFSEVYQAAVDRGPLFARRFGLVEQSR